MIQRLLILNAGSSSLKFALCDVVAPHRACLRGTISGLGGMPAIRVWDRAGSALTIPAPAVNSLSHGTALEWLLGWLRERQDGDIVGVGHRVVHGGNQYAGPVLINKEVFADLEHLVPLAPLHQPQSLAAIRQLMVQQPKLLQVACFDTAFHRTQDAVAQRLALPRDLTENGIKRYGFHGLSYEYIAGVLPQYLGERAEGSVIVAHLGSGASLCAMRNRSSIATTMGFSTLDGLMMGTRCGAIDPGVLLYLMREKHMSSEQLEDLLYQKSGLLGVSGISSDMRELLDSDVPAAREAVELFCYRAVREIGSLVAALGGLDALVFTAGMGERAHEVRSRICTRLAWLELDIDTTANLEHRATISNSLSRVAVCVIPADEEAIIALHTASLLKGT